MIFNIPGHIDMIRNGLYHLPVDNLNSPMEERVVKTQTRRVNRGCYQEGKDYAVQQKRGAKAEPNIRIVMDDIWEESLLTSVGASDGLPINPHISYFNAQAEGGYTPEEYEQVFKKAYPKWDGKRRCVFEFHTIEVRK